MCTVIGESGKVDNPYLKLNAEFQRDKGTLFFDMILITIQKNTPKI